MRLLCPLSELHCFFHAEPGPLELWLVNWQDLLDYSWKSPAGLMVLAWSGHGTAFYFPSTGSSHGLQYLYLGRHLENSGVT